MFGWLSVVGGVVWLDKVLLFSIEPSFKPKPVGAVVEVLVGSRANDPVMDVGTVIRLGMLPVFEVEKGSTIGVGCGSVIGELMVPGGIVVRE